MLYCFFIFLSSNFFHGHLKHNDVSQPSVQVAQKRIFSQADWNSKIYYFGQPALPPEPLPPQHKYILDGYNIMALIKTSMEKMNGIFTSGTTKQIMC